MNRNSVILIITLLTFICYVFLVAFSFELRVRTELWIIPSQLLLGLFILILIGLNNLKLYNKMIAISSLLIVFFYMIPVSGLWKFSLRKYVNEEKENYMELIQLLDNFGKGDMEYISCFNGKVNSRPKIEELERDENCSICGRVCAQIELLDDVEIVLDRPKEKYMFIMDRFIDNGYGLLYLRSDLTEQEILRDRIGGFDITSVVKVSNNWFYVSFT